MEKKTFYTELAYAAGLVVLAFGTALMERADFGMSMVVAPAYLVYLRVSAFWPWFTFGMAEYCFQAVLIIALSAVLHTFKKKFLFSFVTAFVYGNILDAVMKLTCLLPGSGTAFRVAAYIIGMLLCSAGISLLFHTYIAPEAYELFVKEITAKLNADITKVKTIYDCCSCLTAICMSFAFVGFLRFEGVKLGTVFCALINGWLIGRCSALLEKQFTFKDGLRLRKYFV